MPYLDIPTTPAPRFPDTREGAIAALVDGFDTPPVDDIADVIADPYHPGVWLIRWSDAYTDPVHGRAEVVVYLPTADRPFADAEFSDAASLYVCP